MLPSTRTRTLSARCCRAYSPQSSSLPRTTRISRRSSRLCSKPTPPRSVPSSTSSGSLSKSICKSNSPMARRSSSMSIRRSSRTCSRTLKLQSTTALRPELKTRVMACKERSCYRSFRRSRTTGGCNSVVARSSSLSTKPNCIFTRPPSVCSSKPC